MAFFVRDCVRCGVRTIQHMLVGQTQTDAKNYEWEVIGACTDCQQASVYLFRLRAIGESPMTYTKGNIETNQSSLAGTPIRIATTSMELSEYIPKRIAGLFREANECRQMTWYEAAGSMYRKTLDVATKHIFSHDPRLAEKNPANALRSRIKAMGEMGILEHDIVELADIVALDGNDAVHDEDPYTKEEAEALEDLTLDLLDRLFVRPAKIAAVKAKQIASGQRPAE
ncbi:DUF4145 domain-containing protein [Ochrobactrum chromiisoli]|uniref:DUF4145 domain-containing protein n=1 Tax=Ochrobactrum chromiisoli TaxID=2993941 RepID=A0ABT3QM57_9HYPH|nr:DUF4145 domain-containing protein [Ochrobactrum chromiisoli]MCX2696697.1 DUF4145 domain-containing protein [Ochrobactrum chromiisoli]